MILHRLRRCGLSLLLLAASGAWCGPAEIAELEQKLAALRTQVADGQQALRRALGGYGGDPGEEGARLRALKLERARTQAELRKAIAAERERAAVDKSMPTAPAGERLGPKAQRGDKQEKRPVVESAPVATPVPVPAPSL